MSSVSHHRQHLTSADIDMIMRVHSSVCAQNAITTGSLDAERLPALPIREFQHGVNEETALLTAFAAGGTLRLSAPVDRMKTLTGNALDGWEADSKAVFQ